MTEDGLIYLPWLVEWIGHEEGRITLMQMLARAFIVFFYGIFLFRITSPRLFSGHATPIDIMMSVIVGSSLGRVLTGNAPFIEVIITVTLLMGLHTLLTRAAVHWRPLATLLKGESIRLVTNGVINTEAMEANAIGQRDLEEALRSKGLDSMDQVASATLERGGSIEIVQR